MLELLSSPASFLEQPWGLALFILADVVVLVLILALNYKWCAKRLCDLLFSFLGLAVFFPFFLVFFIVQCVYAKRTKAYRTLFTKTYFAGKNEKISHSTEFTCVDREGNLTRLGKVLRGAGIAYYPRFADVFAGRLSFIGPRPLSLADASCLKEEEKERFRVRAGLISSLEKFGGEGLMYAELFEEDAEYAESRSLWKDLSYFFIYLVDRIRGDTRNKYGECAQKSYLQTLEESGAVTREQAEDCRRRAEKKLKNVLTLSEERARYRS